MTLIKKLQECATMGQADPILTRLNAGPAVKKLVETALTLANSKDPQQRNHAYSFMETAIKELEDEDIEVKDEEKIHEEVLDNNNNGSREEGSEQSSDNTEPYPGEGKDTTNGEKPMQDMSDTENQFNETNMGQMPGANPLMPGLSPDIAQEMGAGIQMPQMNPNQMMRQMQYTLQHYHKNYIAPMNRLVLHQKEAIKQLSRELKETKVSAGSMKLDLDTLQNNSTVRFKETVSSPLENSVFAVQAVPHQQRTKVSIARSEIEQMDKMLNSQKNSIYN